MRTTLPLSCSRFNGGEFNQEVAPERSGIACWAGAFGAADRSAATISAAAAAHIRPVRNTSLRRNFIAAKIDKI